MPHAMYIPSPAITPAPAELAAMLGATLADAAAAPARVNGIATLSEAGPDQLSFIASDKALKEVPTSRAGLLLTSPQRDVPGRPRLLVGEGQVWPVLAGLLTQFYPDPQPPAGIDPTALIDPSAQIDPSATVGPYCVVGPDCQLAAKAWLGPHCIVGSRCFIGEGTRLVARVTLVSNVQIGARCLIHPGAVLGADGFKFELTARGPLKIPQVGGIVIEDDVEIGANTCVDRAFLHETRIGRGVKLDNLVQIGHNVNVGQGTVMAAQVGVAGSSKIGVGCIMGGQSGVGDNVTVGDRCILTGQAGVVSNAGPGEMVSGIPHLPYKQYMRSYAHFARLPEFFKRLRALEERMLGGEKK